MKFIKKALVCSILFGLVGCSGVTDPADRYRGESAKHIFDMGESNLRKKNYQEAIKRFESLEVQYPFSNDTPKGQLHLIYSYYMNSDFVLAEATADRFIHTYPTDPTIDYAYFMRGLANYYQNLGVFEKLFAVDLAKRDLAQIKKSFEDFSKVYRRYPHSKYAPAAHQYMVYLRNVLAKHEMQVAQFYFDKQAYVAALNRANDVVRYYQGAPVVASALTMMKSCYEKLQLNQSATEVDEVIKANGIK